MRTFSLLNSRPKLLHCQKNWTELRCLIDTSKSRWSYDNSPINLELVLNSDPSLCTQPLLSNPTLPYPTLHIHPHPLLLLSQAKPRIPTPTWILTVVCCCGIMASRTTRTTPSSSVCRVPWEPYRRCVNHSTLYMPPIRPLSLAPPPLCPLSLAHVHTYSCFLASYTFFLACTHNISRMPKLTVLISVLLLIHVGLLYLLFRWKLVCSNFCSLAYPHILHLLCRSSGTVHWACL